MRCRVSVWGNVDRPAGVAGEIGRGSAVAHHMYPRRNYRAAGEDLSQQPILRPLQDSHVQSSTHCKLCWSWLVACRRLRSAIACVNRLGANKVAMPWFSVLYSENGYGSVPTVWPGGCVTDGDGTAARLQRSRQLYENEGARILRRV